MMTRRGKMLVVTLDDASGQLEVTVYSQLADAHRTRLREDELVILTGVGLDGARLFAERVRHAIEALRVGEVGQVTISAGVAELELGEDEAGPAIARADASLYEAKSRGRNRVI